MKIIVDQKMTIISPRRSYSVKMKAFSNKHSEILSKTT